MTLFFVPLKWRLILCTFSWKPLLKVDAKLFPHASPIPPWCPARIDLIICTRGQPRPLASPSFPRRWESSECPRERESAATSGPDALLQTAFIIFCPPGSGSDKSPVIPVRPGPDREREGGKGEAGLEEVQTKFGSFMIYDRQTGESRITFPGPLSASCLIFPRAPTSPGLILPDDGHLSRLLSPSSCQPRVSSFTWFSPSTAQVGVSSVTPSQHQRPSQILSGLYFHILVSPFPSWEWWEYRNQKLI